MSSNQVRVRYAPSPTGYLHMGALRTAFYNYIFAKQQGGTFILRIEDTDRTRYVEGSVENLIQSLEEMGVLFDEGPGKGGDFGPYFQSERLPIYHQFVEQLIDKGHAYPCFCTKERLEEMRKVQQAAKQNTKYDRHCLHLSKEEALQKIANGEPHTIRLKMPDNRVFIIDDAIRGRVEINSTEVDDQVLIKEDGFPTYHLAAVVDDHLMQITHVFRGEEWLSSAPKHVFLYECFGWEAPKWVHLPLLLNKDRSKLSKRQNDVDVKSYLSKGYLKEAILNFVGLLGWHGADDRELYTVEELIQEFSLDRVTKSGAIFDLEKLDWMNGMYIRSLPLEEIADRCRPLFAEAGIDISNNDKYLKVMVRARDQVSYLSEIVQHAKMFYEMPPISEKDKVVLATEESQRVLQYYSNEIPNLSDCERETTHLLVEKGMEETGCKGKQYFFPLRIAMFGSSSGPDIPMLLGILGKEEALIRIQAAKQLGVQQ